jgi:putative ATP-dependent endonuclease of the OLD family
MPMHPLTTLIGENDAGKTAIIDFLEIMLTNKAPITLDYYRSFEFNAETNCNEETTQNKIVGQIIFTLDETETIQLKNFINEDKNLHIQREFTENNHNISVFSKTFDDFRFQQFDSMSAPDQKMFLTELGITNIANQQVRSEELKKYIELREIPSHYAWRDISLSDIKAFFPKFIRYNTDDYKNPTNMIFKVLQEVYENELYITNQAGQRTIKDESIKKIIESIREKISTASQQFIGHVKKYNSKIQEITIEPDIDLSSGLKQTQIMIKDETGINHYLESRGYGTKKRLFLAIFEWNKEVISKINQEYAIRCYDEPDDSLHIEAQRCLFKAIKSIIEASNKKNQVIICTHSIFMIDSSPADSINLINERRKEIHLLNF